VAGEPARLVEQGQRVLPQAPARHQQRGAPRRPPISAPTSSTWRDEGPEGKLDLLVSIDFRMTSYGPVRRHPAAGGHVVREARPLSTDMHPYVHAFTPAIDPPWETKSDYDIFGDLAKRSPSCPTTTSAFEDLMPSRCGTTPRGDGRSRHGVVKDWRTG
jgi:nitrate reductase alpha subunit